MWTSDKIPVKNIATNNIICYKVFFKKDIIRKKRKFLGITYGKEIVEKYSIFLMIEMLYVIA